MKSRPIHENLDTSFVNLPALIRYLRRRQFSGRVRIELSGYEADIFVSSENQMRVREYDQIAGRVAEGDEALQRILIRSREPGGIINVYQTIAEVEPNAGPVHPKPEVTAAKVATATNGNPPVADFYTETGSSELNATETHAPKQRLPNLPFEFTNRVEAKAKPKTLTADETEMLLRLISELLGTADRALSKAKLNFPNAFHKACLELCTDYPFLMSLEYGQGKVTVPDMPSPKIFVVGVLEGLRKILDKLGTHPKFGEVHRFTCRQLLALASQRKTDYQKFGIIPQLKKLLGV